MSPRAAWRLEQLGFRPVYDYTAGKADWSAAGLPTHRSPDSPRRAADVLDADVPTCGPTATVGQARVLAEEAGRPSVAVVSEDAVVLGRLRPRHLDRDPDRRADEVMEPGPATVRARESLEPLLDRMRKRSVREVLVTTPEGRLLGAVRLED